MKLWLVKPQWWGIRFEPGGTARSGVRLVRKPLRKLIREKSRARLLTGGVPQGMGCKPSGFRPLPSPVVGRAGLVAGPAGFDSLGGLR